LLGQHVTPAQIEPDQHGKPSERELAVLAGEAIVTLPLTQRVAEDMQRRNLAQRTIDA
jgi:hypothetical protein